MAFEAVYDLSSSYYAAAVSSAYLIFGKNITHFLCSKCVFNFSFFFADVGMITLNQYILLDPVLLCFMTASILGMVKVGKSTKNKESFTRRWWLWLFFTGTMLACTISVKFVGLFIVILVGLNTITDLWDVLGDLANPIVRIRYLTLLLSFIEHSYYMILDTYHQRTLCKGDDANCVASFLVSFIFLHSFDRLES